MFHKGKIYYMCHQYVVPNLFKLKVEFGYYKMDLQIIQLKLERIDRY